MERSLIRYQGVGHAALTNGNACIASVIEPYLFDLTVPAEGFSCPAQPIQFGAPAAQADSDGKRLMDAINRDPLRRQSLRLW
jgi:hypothetical protein